MKSRLAFLPAILAIMAVTLACGATGTPTTVEDAAPPLLQPVATNTPDYSDPCANVLYPFIPGRQWIYQKISVDESIATPDPLTSKFGISVESVSNSQATLNALDLATGAATRTTADCQEGAITNFPLMTLGSLFGSYLAGDIAVEYVSGVYAPSIIELEASAWDMEWVGEYIVSGDVTLASEGDAITVTLSNSPVTLTWQNAGQETVTVPAGTYENAYKVTRATRADVTVSAEGLTGQAVITIVTNHWFAPYVGLLKTEIVSATLTTFGISFPMEISGSVELFETTP